MSDLRYNKPSTWPEFYDCTAEQATAAQQWLILTSEDEDHTSQEFAASLRQCWEAKGGLTYKQVWAAINAAEGKRTFSRRKSGASKRTSETREASTSEASTSEASTSETSETSETTSTSETQQDVASRNAQIESLSNAQRTKCRKAICESSKWKAYREEQKTKTGENFNAGKLSSTKSIVDAANACGVDLLKELGTKGQERAETTAKARAEDFFQGTTTETKAETEAHYMSGDLEHYLFSRLLELVAMQDFDGNRLNIMLVGPAAAGKTYACKAAAERLGLSFQFQGQALESYDLLGYVNAKGEYQSTPFVEAFRNGGVFLADEGDAWEAPALLAINAGLANGMITLPTGEQVQRHPDFVCVMATNTFGHGADAEYSARNKLDGATLSRFPVKLDWQIDEPLELRLTWARTKSKDAVDWAREVQVARAVLSELTLPAVADGRTIQAGAAMLAVGMLREHTRQATYLAALDEDQKQAVKNKVRMKLSFLPAL